MARDDESAPKIGSGHLSAMGRQGLRELRAVIYPESNVAQPPVYGIAGELTPGEIRDAREGSPRDADEEKDSVIQNYLRDAESRENRERETTEMERG